MILSGQHTTSDVSARAIPGVTADCLIRGMVVPIGEARRGYRERSSTCQGCCTIHHGQCPCEPPSPEASQH